ncbi:Bug family tripartite tricarboxylate transporter substrate binding protein [Rhodoferax sp.]|uniref:Bug family tripartite tricarboxylate transporter substrate binding protein n=1 Tax=Rhodoferax sp. TaxID=50421 RepID=UPI00374D300A
MLNQGLGRRGVLSKLSGAALAAIAPALYAQTKAIAKDVGKPLAPRLRIVIPASENGGWDQTGRAIGAALVASGACEQIDFENIPGKGGTVGLAAYAQRYAQDPNSMLMGGTVMVGAVALQRPAVTLAQVQPLARLTSDYLVLVVKADSPIRSVADLLVKVRADLKSVPLAGGSAGGIDHIFAGLFARSAGVPVADLVYLPFPGGVQVAEAVVSGKAVAGVSGYSEFAELLASGKLRAIGVSSRRTAFGIPAIRDQKVDAVMSNWRGLFVGSGVTPARLAELTDGVKRATGHASWAKVLQTNHWDGAWLAGADLHDFLELDQTTATAIIYMLKLKA